MSEYAAQRQDFDDLCRWQDDGGMGPDPQWPMDEEQLDNDLPTGEAA